MDSRYWHGQYRHSLSSLIALEAMTAQGYEKQVPLSRKTIGSERLDAQHYLFFLSAVIASLPSTPQNINHLLWLILSPFLNMILQHPIFQLVPEAEVHELLYGIPSQLRLLAKDDVLFRQDDRCEHFHCLASGQVRAQMRSEGKEVTIENFTAPCLLATAILFTSEPRFPVTAIATSEVELFIIERERFIAFLMQHRSALEAFLTDLSERTLFLTQRLRSLALHSLKTRLMEYLAVHGHIHNQEEVAKIMGVARPSLSRALAELVAEGKIQK